VENTQITPLPIRFPQLKEQVGKNSVSSDEHLTDTARAAQVAITVLACWLAAGIVFGFAAIKPVLISEGVYRELCTDDELRDNVNVCLKQDIRYSAYTPQLRRV
jgi:hypothetical protein